MSASAEPHTPLQTAGGNAFPSGPTSPAVLSTGLQLVRASTMASTRLQLALARRDRRQAMAALDGLIDIDAEIERFVAELPNANSIHPEWSSITEHLSEQKAAIASEKFSLACEISGPRLVSAPEHPSAASATEDSNEAEPQPVTGQIILEPQIEPSRSYRWLLLLLLAIAIVILTVVGAYFYMAEHGTDWRSLINANNIFGALSGRQG